MEILNSDSLSVMLRLCRDNTGYRGMIVFDTVSDLGVFIKEFVDSHRRIPVPGIRIIKQRYQSGVIEFTNNSSIYLVLANTTARGKRCNTILFDDVIPISTRDIIKGCIIPFRAQQWEIEEVESLDDLLLNYTPVNRFLTENWAPQCIVKIQEQPSEIADTHELDDFLKEFKITSQSRCKSLCGNG